MSVVRIWSEGLCVGCADAMLSAMTLPHSSAVQSCGFFVFSACERTHWIGDDCACVLQRDCRSGNPLCFQGLLGCSFARSCTALQSVQMFAVHSWPCARPAITRIFDASIADSSSMWYALTPGMM